MFQVFQNVIGQIAKEKIYIKQAFLVCIVVRGAKEILACFSVESQNDHTIIAAACTALEICNT